VTVERDAPQRTKGGIVEARIFVAVGAVVLVATIVYWFWSYEDAGSTMLLLASLAALAIGVYLYLQARRYPDPDEPATPGATSDISGMYLPHASVWPFAVGLGAVVLANGLALGRWALVPGIVLLLAALGGFVRQSRRRD
jgi:hypothetical protein